MELENVAALRLLMNDDLYFIKTENQSRYADDLQGIQLVDEKVPVKTVLFTDYLGNNEKNIMIIVSSDLLPQHQTALENSLTRKQLTLSDVAIIDYSKIKGVVLDDLIEKFHPQKMIFFGIDNKSLGLPEPAVNEVIIYKNIRTLVTYSFSEMLGNKEKTRAYWDPMKAL